MAPWKGRSPPGSRRRANIWLGRTARPYLRHTIPAGRTTQQTISAGRGGIPFLKDIPLIGWLFGSTTESETQNELFLFLTPHVVLNDADADRMLQEIEKNSKLLDPIKPIAPFITPRDGVRVVPDTGVKVIKPIKPDSIK